MPYTPAAQNIDGVVAGIFTRPPKGVILHGSRSGAVANSTHAEFLGTANYAHNNPDGLGWNATIGDDEIAMHMLSTRWGWNARACSMSYLAVEFAQPVAATPVTDAQVRAFCWFFEQSRRAWPTLPLYLPTHAELDGTPEYGGYHDGKTDVFPKGDFRADALRTRIINTLAKKGVS